MIHTLTGKRHALRHPYPAVYTSEGLSHGGSQNWSSDRTLKGWGCGVVAATDLLLYLSHYRPGCLGTALRGAQIPMEQSDYEDLIQLLRHRYFPILPKFGLNCFVLAGGLNRYFHENHIPLRCGWGVTYTRLWQTVEEMLSNDLPVILCVGHNFPLLWQKYGLTFYRKTGESRYERSCDMSGHFVTVTAMDDAWLQIASWGREYYISRGEYTTFLHKHSNTFFTNILTLRSIPSDAQEISP